MKPRSVEQLAMVLALIRPGKRHLIGKIWPAVESEIWKLSNDGEYVFKKSHAIGYALAIVVQMNLMIEEAVNDKS
jgi:DNA polymerase III alpha subunit